MELIRWLVRLKSVVIAFCGYKLLVFTFEVKQTLVFNQSVSLENSGSLSRGVSGFNLNKKCCALRMTGFWLELMVHILIFAFAVS